MSARHDDTAPEETLTRARLARVAPPMLENVPPTNTSAPFEESSSERTVPDTAGAQGSRSPVDRLMAARPYRRVTAPSGAFIHEKSPPMIIVSPARTIA